MRRHMTLDLEQHVPDLAMPDGISVRTPAVEDQEALAHLMLDAYQGTVDDEGESIDDARKEVEVLLAGDYGAPMFEMSILAEADGVPASAALLTFLKDAPFVAFSMTAAIHKRRGLARACLEHAADRLKREGYTSLHLEVTPGNSPAERMYVEMGFTDCQGGA